ncbi:TPA: hypothetical protein QCY38_005892 [Bacillus toyonensis]|uniref:hypothetical protein n=1 Tax=Bacillus cereus group TaxID=86661 RepID=UPI00030CE6BF|nr:hypothetical protein [Bacillus toyonensis]OTX01387.1 hypothetical protein BK712_27980 [Bacillus thuringiensis serovar seoulensis]MCA1043023.1 hypothetical protein [Bacillus toyonensis]MDO8160532.1 hypothetical protein [Bacillus toyonensis]MED3196817.1 hypothetical protein [Bacillus toyonensis]MED3540960.1 hypothetical protein [Bacillus toyonensis]
MGKVQEIYQRFQEDMKRNHTAKRNDFQHCKEFLLFTHMLLTMEVSEINEKFRTNIYKTECQKINPP